MRALLIVIGIALPVGAFADTKAEAVALFNEGMKEMKAGNYDKACAAFEKSNHLYVDSGTRGSLARCYEKLGRVASAWKLWTALSETAPVKLRPDAAANAAKLEPRLPKYVLRVPKNAPSFQAYIDGVVIDATPDAPTPIDPGKHVLRVESAGYSAFERAFEAVEGKTEELVLELLAIETPDPDPPPVTPEGPTRVAPSSTKRKVGFALIGVGGAFVIGGSVFGILAKSRNDDAKDICGGSISACDPSRLTEAQDKVDSARTAGHISTVAFIAGGAAVVTGIVLVVTAPKTKTQVAVTPNGVLLTRNF